MYFENSGFGHYLSLLDTFGYSLDPTASVQKPQSVQKCPNPARSSRARIKLGVMCGRQHDLCAIESCGAVLTRIMALADFGHFVHFWTLWTFLDTSELSVQNIDWCLPVGRLLRMFFGRCSPHALAGNYLLQPVRKYKNDLMVIIREIWIWTLFNIFGHFWTPFLAAGGVVSKRHGVYKPSVGVGRLVSGSRDLTAHNVCNHIQSGALSLG